MREFSAEERELFEWMADSLSFFEKTDLIPAEDIDIHEIVELSYHQAVLPIIYGKLMAADLAYEDKEFVKDTYKMACGEFYAFFFDLRKMLLLFKGANIPVVVLKGVSAARFYPVPESRKSSDIDLLLCDTDDMKRADDMLKRSGYRLLTKGYNIVHHFEYATPTNHILELHMMPAEPFDDEKLNRYIREVFRLGADDVMGISFMGADIPVMKDGKESFHLLIHMLQDFRRTGFGLKLLCDWVVFWNRDVEEEEKEKFLKLVRESGVTKFAAAVTGVCEKYLGLKTDISGKLNCPVDDGTLSELMADIVEAERNGKPSDDRMVNLRGTGVLSYIREFHHNVELNFPRAAKTVIAIPVLYVIVFFRFLRNNRTVRNGQKVSGILKSAGKRSRLSKKLL